MSELRNSSGAIVSQFFDNGQTLGGANYFYAHDLHGSITELFGVAIGAQYVYDSYGQPTVVQGTVASDFQYCGYYLHSTSGLSFAKHRAYSSKLGRWLNRDPSSESGGVNLYDYAQNDPIDYEDSSGESSIVEYPWWFIWWWYWWNNHNNQHCQQTGSGSGGGNTGGGGLPPPPPEDDGGDDPPPTGGGFRKEPEKGSGSGGGGGGRRPDDTGPQTPRVRSKIKKRTTKPATDIPSWARGNFPRQGENGKDFARRLLDGKYGSGNYGRGPGSEFNQLKKYGDREFAN